MGGTTVCARAAGRMASRQFWPERARRSTFLGFLAAAGLAVAAAARFLAAGSTLAFCSLAMSAPTLLIWVRLSLFSSVVIFLTDLTAV